MSDSEELLRLFDLNMFTAAINYDINERSERSRSSTALSLLFFRLVKELVPDLFIEAGAKDATSSRRARRYLKDARIVAFEANPFTHERFHSKNQKASIEYMNLGVSDSVGPATFNVRMSSDGRPLPDGRGSLIKRGDYDVLSPISVDCTTLDAYFEVSEYTSCALWIDVEGASRQVLEGAATILPRTTLIMIEVEDHEFWPGAWLSNDVLSHLYRHGLVPIARDFQTKYQYNVVLVRRDLLNVEGLRWALARFYSGLNEATTKRSANNGPLSKFTGRYWKRRITR